MLILNRRPVDSTSDSFTRKDVNRDVGSSMPPENIPGRFFSRDTRSHDLAWADRREDSLRRFAERVKGFVEPLGFVAPFAEHAPEFAAKGELNWLIETQSQEIAPEYARLAANGVEAFSMFSSYTDSNGEEHQIADDIAEHLWTDAIVQTLDERQEAFLREADRRRWYSSRPKVAYEVVNDDGKRFMVPKERHPWTVDELIDLMKHFQSPQAIAKAMKRRSDPKSQRERSAQGPSYLLTPVERAKAKEFKRVIDFLNESDDDPTRDRQMTATEGSDTSLGYAPNEDCPNCSGSGIEPEFRSTMLVEEEVLTDTFDWHHQSCSDCDWTAKTLFNKVFPPRSPDEHGHLFDSDEPCSACYGSLTVAHTLGFDGLPAIDPTF